MLDIHADSLLERNRVHQMETVGAHAIVLLVLDRQPVKRGAERPVGEVPGAVEVVLGTGAVVSRREAFAVHVYLLIPLQETQAVMDIDRLVGQLIPDIFALRVLLHIEHAARVVAPSLSLQHGVGPPCHRALTPPCGVETSHLLR